MTLSNYTPDFRSSPGRLSSKLKGSSNLLLKGSLLALFALVLGALCPDLLFAGASEGYQPGIGIQTALITIQKTLQGPIARITAAISMIAVLGGIIFRSQRGESVNGLAAVGVAIILIMNIQTVLSVLGVQEGATMVQSRVETFLPLMS